MGFYVYYIVYLYLIYGFLCILNSMLIVYSLQQIAQLNISIQQFPWINGNVFENFLCNPVYYL